MRQHFIIRLLVILSLLAGHAGLRAQSGFVAERGTGSFTFRTDGPFADRPIEVHYHIPSGGDLRQMPILFVFEGADRGYDYLLRAWREEAEQRQFILFLPHFDQKAYPLSDYQEVGVMNATHTEAHPQERLTPTLIDSLFLQVRRTLQSRRKGYRIYGHSAGGQFVQRFMLFHETPYVEKAIIGSPGWYTFPDPEQCFPYGVANIPYITPERIRDYLAKPIVLQLAPGDSIREWYLRKTPEADRQGRNRYERGRTFWDYLHRIAAAKGWPCRWEKAEVPGVGHNSIEMGRQAAPLLTEAGDSLRALFIGNSYTFYNDLIQQVQALAASNGRKLAVRKVTYGGWTLQQHADHPETVEALKSGGWDFVVLQEQSQAPAREPEWVEANVYPPAFRLDSLRRLYSPQGETVFYMTWGRNNGTYESMQKRLAESYLTMSDRTDARCAPVGIAWKRVRTERPGIQLYDPDTSHPSLQGSYLAANVFYTTFFGKPYTSGYLAGLPREEAIYLQRTAQEVVLSNPLLWNLRKCAQPEAVARQFYPDPVAAYPSPTLSKPAEEGVASLEEIRHYLQQLAEAYPAWVTLDTLGSTPQGREIPILYFGSAQAKKRIRVWIQAGLHGNEPAGPEAACLLADYLLRNEEGRRLLEQTSLALLPVANVDGYALQERRSGSGYDLNRDQSKLADSISLLLKQAYNRWEPEVALDIHEFNPIRPEFARLRNSPAATAPDVLFLPSGHPNIPSCLRTLSEGVFRQEAEQALRQKGYQSGFYFTPTLRGDTLLAMKDAKSPQSSSTFQGLNNAVSLFIEIRGIGLGRTSFARRADCGFTVCRSLLQTVARHRREVRKSVAKAVKENCSASREIVVTFKPTRTERTVSFIDLSRGERFEQSLPTLDAMQPEPLLTRPRPRAYLLPDTCHRQAEKLRSLGIRVEQLKTARRIAVEKYIVSTRRQSPTTWEGIRPVSVSTRIVREEKWFPAGSYYIPLAQKRGNLAATLLEPESACGFVNFCILPAIEGEELPLYRAEK